MYQFVKAKVLSNRLVRRVFKIKDEIRGVGHVLSAFNNAVADLESVAVQHAGIAVAHAREIEQRVAAKAQAEAESAKATIIAAKMKAVFQ